MQTMPRHAFMRSAAMTLLVLWLAACAPRPAPDAAAPAEGAAAGSGATAADYSEHAPRDIDAPLRGDSHADAMNQGHATLQFVYVPATGFAGRDDAGRPTGATVELLRDFGQWLVREHGIAVDIDWREQPDWSSFYRQVSEGQGGVFGVGNVTITDARRNELDFSPPYMQNVAVLVTNDAVPELASMDAIGTAFAGKQALAFPGTLHETRLRDIGRRAFGNRLAMDTADSNDLIVQRLAEDSQGRYFAYLDAYNLERARQQGKPLRRHAVGDDASETFGVILPPGSDWTPVIAAFLEADGGYTRSARWREQLTTHLGPELTAVLLD